MEPEGCAFFDYKKYVTYNIMISDNVRIAKPGTTRLITPKK